MTDQVVIQRADTSVAPEGHEAAMIAKVDGVEAPAPKAEPSAERPSWLPEKFATPEDFAKSYSELEAKQSGKPTEEAPKAPEGEADPAPKAGEEGAAEAELASKGLDLGEFSTEFSQKGELSPESYDRLAKAGYPQAIVDQYIAGQTALAAQYEAEVKGVAGGAEEFAKVSSWAAENLTDAEKIAYNKAIDSGDVAQAKLAVQGITAKYQQSYPSEGALVTGNTGKVAASAYGDLAEMKADMADPRYRESPAFRAQVAEKLGRSNIM